jgi:hypothetical protein
MGPHPATAEVDFYQIPDSLKLIGRLTAIYGRLQIWFFMNNHEGLDRELLAD